MSIFTIQLKTHSRIDLTKNYPDLNPCLIHGTKPKILRIVAGKHKDIHYVAVCQHNDCGKITETADKIVSAWNKHNPPLK